MKKLNLEHSNYTKSSKILYSRDAAMQYLYFNGKLSVNCSKHQFIDANLNRSNTICNHIRTIHALTWFRSETLLNYMLYAISDSKFSVDMLRYKKNDPNFDIGWWRSQQIEVFNKNDSKDEFYTSNIFRKSSCFNKKNEMIAYELINEDEKKSPIIYKKYYKKILKEILNLEDKELASKLKKIVLTCVYMRYRIDQRIIYHEKNLFSGNFLRLFYNKFLIIFLKKFIERLYQFFVKINCRIRQIFF